MGWVGHSHAPKIERAPSGIGMYRSVGTSQDPSDNPVAKRSRSRRMAGALGQVDGVELSLAVAGPGFAPGSAVLFGAS